MYTIIIYGRKDMYIKRTSMEIRYIYIEGGIYKRMLYSEGSYMESKLIQSIYGGKYTQGEFNY